MPNGPPLSLDTLSAEISLQDTIKLRQQQHAEQISSRLITLFGWSVGCTWALALILAAADYTFIGRGWMAAADRLVTEKVLLAIIAATIAQLGAVVAGIIYAVFKSPPPDPDET
ncbi:hypothetical protein ADL19_13560 [Streptomyces purpurogeneiscleroticus]|nr:hypothetical protein ADL19_13560 [Streptomyces purpurogeneiscleroticus]